MQKQQQQQLTQMSECGHVAWRGVTKQVLLFTKQPIRMHRLILGLSTLTTLYKQV